MIKITLPDKSVKEFDEGITPRDIAKSISDGLARDAIAAKVNEELVDIYEPIESDSSIELITKKDEESLPILRHTTAHIFAQALLRLYPEAKITVGPAIEHGFYYDVDLEGLDDDHLPRIEEEMQKIIKEDLGISYTYKTKEEALEFFKSNSYKTEIIEAIFSGELSEDEEGEGDVEEGKVKFYRQGEFEDLCSGPHLPRTGLVKAFKLERVTRAYWRGDANNKQLYRVYGSAFWKKSEMEEHYRLIEEAKKRDHRVLGKQMGLFMFHEYSPGCAFFLPKGFKVYKRLQDFIRREYERRGYEEVMTPNLFNSELWKISGHWQHYKDDMFTLKVEGADYALKPMNCPSHCLIFKSDFRSYRDLPMRIADFGALHRNELSGTLSGLTRVRKLCQDDAHIFCTADQIEGEIDGVLKFIDYVYREVFSMEYNIELSTRPEKELLGSEEVWDKAENALSNAIKKNGKDYKLNPGDGAFYGPKIDFNIRDCLGRDHQTATLQLDFNLPEQFELRYNTQDDGFERPVMIHRAVMGSIERFMAVMIEHFAGKLPLWLSPVQVKILNVADRHVDYCKSIEEKLKEKGFNIEANYDSQTISNKIRLAQSEKVNYIVVIGDDEVESDSVAARDRNNETHKFSLEEFIEMLEEERDNKLIKY